MEEEEEWPITIRTRSTRVDGAYATHPDDGLIQCRYMIGADGAHSWVRQQVGFVMEGEQTESVWGVMDIIPITDFRKPKLCQ